MTFDSLVKEYHRIEKADGHPTELLEKRLALDRAAKERLQEFDALGKHLFDTALPKEFKEMYWEHIAESDAQSFLIRAREHWIPWELIKPWQLGKEDEPFWGERFRLGRWFLNVERQPTTFRVKHFRSVKGQREVQHRNGGGGSASGRLRTANGQHDGGRRCVHVAGSDAD